jgi:hypothetical protein
LSSAATMRTCGSRGRKSNVARPGLRSERPDGAGQHEGATLPPPIAQLRTPLPFACPGVLPAWRMLWIKSVRVSVPDISTRSGFAHLHKFPDRRVGEEVGCGGGYQASLKKIDSRRRNRLSKSCSFCLNQARAKNLRLIQGRIQSVEALAARWRVIACRYRQPHRD